MLESMLEAQGLHEGERRLGTLSAVALAHVGIGIAILAVTATIVHPIPPAHVRPVLVTTSRIRLDDLSPRPASLPAKLGSKTDRSGGKTVAPAPPRELMPTTTPDRITEVTPETSSPGREGPGDGDRGDPNGSPNGVPDGSGDVGVDGNGSGPADPVFLTGEMQKPVLLEKVEPEYPIMARRIGMGGRVTLQAVIAPDGSVESVEVLASKNPLFNQAAVDAVSKWRYRPALMNGSPVRVYFTVVVDFVVR